MLERNPPFRLRPYPFRLAYRLPRTARPKYFAQPRTAPTFAETARTRRQPSSLPRHHPWRRGGTPVPVVAAPSTAVAGRMCGLCRGSVQHRARCRTKRDFSSRPTNRQVPPGRRDLPSDARRERCAFDARRRRTSASMQRALPPPTVSIVSRSTLRILPKPASRRRCSGVKPFSARDRHHHQGLARPVAKLEDVAAKCCSICAIDISIRSNDRRSDSRTRLRWARRESTRRRRRRTVAQTHHARWCDRLACPSSCGCRRGFPAGTSGGGRSCRIGRGACARSGPRRPPGAAWSITSEPVPSRNCSALGAADPDDRSDSTAAAAAAGPPGRRCAAPHGDWGSSSGR